jgi:hypothetical protein
MTDAEKPVRKPPRRVTPAYLQRAALAYLERYASSAENLRRVLRRKVDKRCRLRGEEPSEFYDMIDEVVAKSLSGGLIDDTRYAEARVASLRRRGGSARALPSRRARTLPRQGSGGSGPRGLPVRRGTGGGRWRDGVRGSWPFTMPLWLASLGRGGLGEAAERRARAG